MDIKKQHLIETMIWIGIPLLFIVVDWFYKQVLNIEYLELSILLFIVVTIYRVCQNS